MQMATWSKSHLSTLLCAHTLSASTSGFVNAVLFSACTSAFVNALVCPTLSPTSSQVMRLGVCLKHGASRMNLLHLDQNSKRRCNSNPVQRSHQRTRRKYCSQSRKCDHPLSKVFGSDAFASLLPCAVTASSEWVRYRPKDTSLSS
eukprot:scaffold6164_cov89-Skeletonema_dohrnii-CCMP3373.AAC.3